jgi:hypothetical protein
MKACGRSALSWPKLRPKARQNAFFIVSQKKVHDGVIPAVAYEARCFGQPVVDVILP